MMGNNKSLAIYHTEKKIEKKGENIGFPSYAFTALYHILSNMTANTF